MPLCPQCKKPLPAGAKACPACAKPRASRPPSSTPDGATVLLSDSARKATAAAAEAAAGMRFGPYEIVREVARGAMGIVYKAKDTKLDRFVALKVLISGELAGEHEVARFQREAQAAAKLRHPHIVPIYDVGESGGRHYFTMEFVEGASLHQLFSTKQTPIEQAVRLIAQVSDAMEHAHTHGVIHRDLKPANILVDAEGNSRVTDFGLSKAVHGSHLTESGTTLGTPSYMPPEQARGLLKEVDARSDVYALGAILYEALAGVPPFLGENNVDTILRVVKEDPIPPRRLNPKVPPELEAVCLKALEKEKARRYASAKEFGDDLRRWLAKEPVLARPASLASRIRRKIARNAKWVGIAAAIVLANLILIGVLAGRKRSTPLPKNGNTAGERDAALLAGDKLRERGMYDLAREVYQEALQTHPTGPIAEEARYLVAECAFRGAEASQDAAALAEARDLLQAVTDPTWAPKAKQALEECGRLLAAGEPTDGVGTLPGLTPSDPLNRIFSALIAKGKMDLTPERQAELEKRKDAAVAARQRSKDATKAVTDYAACLIVQAKWKEAEDVLLQAIPLTPAWGEINVWLLVAFCRFQREDFAGVEAAVRAMTNSAPQDLVERIRQPSRWSPEDRQRVRELFQQAWKSKDPAKFVEENPLLKKVQEEYDAKGLLPSLQYARTLHILALAHQGRAEEAVRVAEAAIERERGNGEGDARTRLVRAQAMRLAGDLRGARKAFDEMAKKSRDWVGFEALLKLVETSILMGQPGDAAKGEKEAMEIFKTPGQQQRLALWFGLARALDGHVEKAREMWKAGLSIPSSDQATRVALRYALGQEPPQEDVDASQITIAERKLWRAVGLAVQGKNDDARRLAAAAAKDAIGKEHPYEIATHLAAQERGRDH